MGWLGARLKVHGFQAEYFGYHSIVGDVAAAEDRLAAQLATGPCHVVAHSLGGLVALETLSRHPGLPVERVVCLGTPLCGSGAAAGLKRWPLAPLWMGRSAELLGRGCVTWPESCEVAMVAGRVPRGLGAFFAGFDGDHDGTVSVGETRVPGLAGHVVVDASHSGLLFSQQVAGLVAGFLGTGRLAVPEPSASV